VISHTWGRVRAWRALKDGRCRGDDHGLHAGIWARHGDAPPAISTPSSPCSWHGTRESHRSRFHHNGHHEVRHARRLGDSPTSDDPAGPPRPTTDARPRPSNSFANRVRTDRGARRGPRRARHAGLRRVGSGRTHLRPAAGFSPRWGASSMSALDAAVTRPAPRSSPAEAAWVVCRVITTDEELMIARATAMR